MTIKVKYDLVLDGHETRARLRKIRALPLQDLPCEYVFGRSKDFSENSHCGYEEGDHTLVVYDSVEREYMGKRRPGTVKGYRAGDILELDELSKLMRVLKTCGERLHEINKKNNEEYTVLAHGVFEI